MDLTDAFGLKNTKNEVISLTGGGGKTSILFALAEELKLQRKKVLVTTTTAIYMPEESRYDYFFLREDGTAPLKEDLRRGKGSVTMAGGRITEEGKLKGVDSEWIDALHKEKVFDIILVEADGAKKKPVKAPDLHEPVVPSCTTILVGVIGIDCYEKKIDAQWVHRPQLLARIAGKSEGEAIDAEVLVKLAASGEGIFKSCPEQADKVLFINKADNKELCALAVNIGRLVMQRGCGVKKVLIGSVLGQAPVKEIL